MQKKYVRRFVMSPFFKKCNQMCTKINISCKPNNKLKVRSLNHNFKKEIGNRKCRDAMIKQTFNATIKWLLFSRAKYTLPNFPEVQ